MPKERTVVGMAGLTVSGPPGRTVGFKTPFRVITGAGLIAKGSVREAGSVETAGAGSIAARNGVVPCVWAVFGFGTTIGGRAGDAWGGVAGVSVAGGGPAGRPGPGGGKLEAWG